MRDYDCPLAEAQIIWDPVDNPSLPAVDVVRHSFEDDNRYENAWGACNEEFCKASSAEKLEMLLAQFVYITAHDGVSAADTYKAFRQIPEFRGVLGKVGWSE